MGTWIGVFAWFVLIIICLVYGFDVIAEAISSDTWIILVVVVISTVINLVFPTTSKRKK